MENTIGFRAWCLMVCLMVVGVDLAKLDNDFFTRFPTTTAYNVLEPVSAFRSIVCKKTDEKMTSFGLRVWYSCPLWKIQAGWMMRT